MNGVQGNQAAQVRMFAHDAREVQLVKGNSTGAGAMNSCVMTCLLYTSPSPRDS